MKNYIRILCLMLLSLPTILQAQDKQIFKKNPQLVKIAENTLMDLGVYDFERPKGEPFHGHITDYSGMVYDMHNNRILQFGGGHSATVTDAIYVFDFKTLKWSSLYTPTPYKYFTEENLDGTWWKAGLKNPKVGYPRPLGRHTYLYLTILPERKEMLMLRHKSFIHSFVNKKPKGRYLEGDGGYFDFKTNSWKRIPHKDTIGFGDESASYSYDPIGKKMISFHSRTMYIYDPVTRKSKRVWRDAPKSIGLTYFPPQMKFYWFRWKEKEVWEVQLNRKEYSKTKLIKTTMKIPDTVCPGMMVYDSKNKVFAGFMSRYWNDKKYHNKFTTFNPSTGIWETKTMLGGSPDNAVFYNHIYSPLDNAHIFIGREASGDRKMHTWAYRWK